MKTTHILCLAWVLSHAAACRAAAQTAHLTPEFLAALRAGDARQLRAALDGDAAPNARDARGSTPLILAAGYGDATGLRLLLDRGAEVNATNAAGSTALLRAAADFEKLALLVQRGAEVNARSAVGNTPLMLAARPANSHRAVALLLAHGADAKATNHFGATALMAAAAGGDAQSVRLLLKHGANPNAQPGVGPGQFVFGGGRSALMWAAYRGDLAILKLLVDAGANMNAEGNLGTPLSQAVWANHTAAARWLLDHGANAKQVSHMDDYTPLHWAASSEERDDALVKLLLQHGGDPNAAGGAQVDAFLDVPQTPLMLARRRGETPILNALVAAGATNGTPDRLRNLTPPAREWPAHLDAATVRSALNQAVPPLQETALVSKQSFVNHASHQDCTSCHQQYLPLAAIGLARQQQVNVDATAAEELVKMVGAGELKNHEVDWAPVFHPDPVFTKGYALFGYANAGLPADEFTDSAVHHLAAIQGKDGRWFNNLPRPPLQTDDLGATALAVHALQKYPLPGRRTEFAQRVEHARRWLGTARPENTEGRVYQLLGLAWAGESPDKLQPLAKAILAEQRPDGGWAQLPNLKSDALATGQAVYALHLAVGMRNLEPAMDRARRFLLTTQLADGTWYVRRRAFPFQPTMDSGFPHGRDGWISASASSWAVMALSLPVESGKLARSR